MSGKNKGYCVATRKHLLADTLDHIQNLPKQDLEDVVDIVRMCVQNPRLRSTILNISCASAAKFEAVHTLFRPEKNEVSGFSELLRGRRTQACVHYMDKIRHASKTRAPLLTGRLSLEDMQRPRFVLDKFLSQLVDCENGYVIVQPNLRTQAVNSLISFFRQNGVYAMTGRREKVDYYLTNVLVDGSEVKGNLGKFASYQDPDTPINYITQAGKDVKTVQFFFESDLNIPPSFVDFLYTRTTRINAALFEEEYQTSDHNPKIVLSLEFFTD